MKPENSDKVVLWHGRLACAFHSMRVSRSSASYPDKGSQVVYDTPEFDLIPAKENV